LPVDENLLTLNPASIAVTVITEEELTRAIERTLVAHGKITPEEARPTARMVMGYFGHDDAVLDNKLTSDDRDHFYRLEEEGLLTSEEEDATVSRGKTWRIHYWLLKKGRIRDVGETSDHPQVDSAEAVYREMGDSVWNRSEVRPARPPIP
jgi:hypothetical protein